MFPPGVPSRSILIAFLGFSFFPDFASLSVNSIVGVTSWSDSLSCNFWPTSLVSCPVICVFGALFCMIGAVTCSAGRITREKHGAFEGVSVMGIVSIGRSCSMDLARSPWWNR